jgi:hypothetical protein
LRGERFDRRPLLERISPRAALPGIAMPGDPVDE